MKVLLFINKESTMKMQKKKKAGFFSLAIFSFDSCRTSVTYTLPGYISSSIIQSGIIIPTGASSSDSSSVFVEKSD